MNINLGSSVKLKSVRRLFESRDGQAVILLSILGVSLYIAYLAFGFGMALTPDSLAYREAAMNLHAGNGLSLRQLSLPPSTGFAPFTSWPPLYPSLLSAVMLVTRLPVDTSATLLSSLSLAASGVLLFLIARYAMASVYALLLALVFLLHTSTLTIHSYMWSEGIFVALMLGSLLCALKARGHFRSSADREGWLFLMASVGLVVLAAHARYIGAAFLIFPLTSAYYSDSRPRTRLVRSVAVSAGYGLSMLPLLIRNYWLTGHLSGIGRPNSGKALTENLADLAAALKYQFLDFAPTATVMLVAVVLLILVLAVLDYKTRDNRTVIEKDVSTGLILYAVGGICSYYTLLIALRTWKTFDSIDTRLVSPGVVLGLLFLFAINIRFSRNYPDWKKRVVILLPILLFSTLSTAKGYLKLMESHNAWRVIGSPVFIASRSMVYSNFNNARLKNKFQKARRSLAGENQSLVVYSDRPRILAYLMDQPVYRMPYGRLDNDRVAILNEKGKNGVIVIMTRSGFFTMYKAYGRRLEGLNIGKELKLRGLMVIRLPLPVAG